MGDYDIDVLERVGTRTLSASIRRLHYMLSDCGCLFCPTSVYG
jgi:hypothetical protein